MQPALQDTAAPDSGRAVRNLEERYNNLIRRVQVLEENVITANKKAHSEFKTLNSEITDLKKQAEDLNEKIEFIIKELHTLAKREDVDVLKKYLNLWEPVNFITRSEAEKIAKRAAEEITK
ncbi:hypothetical protein HY640_03010 [Candidatus Woesearchaeota archaeon]|nr:hypothetical protein [Candidatus Woesearchaeota archaeon]